MERSHGFTQDSWSLEEIEQNQKTVNALKDWMNTELPNTETNTLKSISNLEKLIKQYTGKDIKDL